MALVVDCTNRLSLELTGDTIESNTQAVNCISKSDSRMTLLQSVVTIKSQRNFLWKDAGDYQQKMAPENSHLRVSDTRNHFGLH